MRVRGHSLRSLFNWMTCVLGGIAFVTVVILVILTAHAQRTSTAMEASMHGVRIAEEAQVDLLLHAHTSSQIVKRDLAGSMQRRLAEIDTHVGGEREREVLDEAKAQVEQYIRASRSEEEVAMLLPIAFSALEELVNINVVQAEEEARLAARVDTLAGLGGLALGFLILGAAVFLLYWARGLLVRPIWELRRAMQAFGEGRLDTRARVTRPRELVEIAERFNDMADQIERQREHQRAFLGGVAHDLRNPVNALLLSAEVARSDDSLPPEHPMRRALERGTRQLRKLDRMISDFLDAAAVEAGELELQLEVRDMRGILRSTVQLFEDTSARHEVILSVPEQPVRAVVDPLRIEQVATNLISNAIKYSPAGGRVDVRLERREHELLLEVEDHGLGISREAWSQLFQPFRRGLSRESIPGVGLGLFVVRRIVEAHHGRIDVESVPGAGTTFRVLLPSEPMPATVEQDGGGEGGATPPGYRHSM